MGINGAFREHHQFYCKAQCGPPEGSALGAAVAVVRGMRISVELFVSLLAQGETPDAILKDYPGLTREDIQACLAYAHAVIANHSLDAVQVGG